MKYRHVQHCLRPPLQLLSFAVLSALILVTNDVEVSDLILDGVKCAWEMVS